MYNLVFKLVGVFGILGLLLAPVNVAAESGSNPIIEIPVNTIVRGDAGSEHELDTASVPSEYVGLTCDVMATAKNQSSVHPGNDLRVSSGADSVTLEDVERAPNVTTTADEQLTLGSDVTVTLVLGNDKVFSGGMTVKIHCEEPPEPCPYDKNLTVDDKECFKPCPYNKHLAYDDPNCVEPCPYNKELAVDDKDCYEPCEYNPSLPADSPDCYEPCEYDPSIPADDPDCGEVEGETDTPDKELPNTGPTSVALGAFGLSAVAATTKTWIDSRRK